MHLAGPAASNAALLLVPAAGGGALAFRPWLTWLERLPCSVWALRLPGREDLVGHSPCQGLPEVIDLALEDMPSAARTTIFGQCVGGLMAYELAHALQQDGRGLDLVVVAGPSPMAYTSDVREDTDAALTAHLRERDGVAISARVEQLFLDIIRGDRALTYDYSRPSREPLSAQAVVITPAMETGHPLLTRAWDREFRDDPRHISIREPSLLPSHGQGFSRLGDEVSRVIGPGTRCVPERS